MHQPLTGAPTYDQSPSFIMKVMAYVALAFALMGVGAFTGPMIMPPPFSMGLFYGIVIFEMILIWTCHKWAALPRPWNFVMFVFVAFLTGLTAYPLLWYALAIGGTELIVTALGATVLLALAAGYYAMTTKRDLRGIGGFLMMALIGLIIVGVLQIFFFSALVELISAAVGVVLFSAFIAYDVQMLRHFPEDRAMEAAIMLYISLFNLFISVLRLIIALSGRD